MAYDHARREQIARDKGFSSYRAYRQATPAQRLAATRRAAPAQVGRVQHARGGRRQIFPLPSGDTLVHTTRDATLASQLRRADESSTGARVTTLVVTIVEDDGTTRDVRLLKKGGDDAGNFLARADATGGVTDYIANLISDVYGIGGGFAITDVQLVIS